ncbi:hypothetical protein CZ787_16060 [Halomonas citrativorans]|uniref:Uncharacterized protein n=1 Tax=Halomonas citrativorans TaxID=2742612 RepID=A0A1R4I407_9GAMM|nr:hypothetical protein CZ787_16060 [Halomonas citrativorans]
MTQATHNKWVDKKAFSGVNHVLASHASSTGRFIATVGLEITLQ